MLFFTFAWQAGRIGNNWEYCASYISYKKRLFLLPEILMNYLLRLFSSIGLDWFLPGLLMMVGLAYLFPGPGVAEQPVSLAELANYGVTGIFFFYGLKLDFTTLKKGLSNWRMHVLIQLSTFLLFPALILLIRPLFNTIEKEQIWLGIFFLAALPSTVSSSVVMVSIAGGNVPAAIFNASISAFIGVFITPLWMGMVLHQNAVSPDSSDVVLKLIWQVVIPVILGLLLNKHYGHIAGRHKKSLKTFDQLIILLIVYTSFSHSFSEQLFDSMSLYELIFLGTGMFVLFALAVFLMKICSRFLKFNHQDIITVVFCGSKKSLVHGTVMAGILFTGTSLTGIIILPVMLYHAIQLIAASALAKKMAAQAS